MCEKKNNLFDIKKNFKYLFFEKNADKGKMILALLKNLSSHRKRLKNSSDCAFLP